MNLLEKINDDMKAAMKEKRAEELSTLRMLIAAMKNKEISLRQGGKAELNNAQIAEVISSEIKKRKDSIDAYKQGNRQDLADKEQKEIDVLKKYLPAQLSDEEVEKAVKEILVSGETNFGKVMGQAMAKLKGQADGSRVGEMVKKLLAKR